MSELAQQTPEGRLRDVLERIVPEASEREDFVRRFSSLDERERDVHVALAAALPIASDEVG